MELDGLRRRLDGLTDKQREVLNLLVQHKTSKEIARILGISPYTVDQRIAAARRKLNARSRNELAATYQSATSDLSDQTISEGSVYQSSQVGKSDETRDEGSGNDANVEDRDKHPDATNRSGRNLPVVDYRVVPESFEGNLGYFWRVAAIVGITLIFLIVVLVGFAIFAQLSDLLS